MLRQWTAVYHYEWTPIITFPRRRLELLDWIEANTEPAAFVDSGNHVGLAYVSEEMRVVVHKAGMTIETGFDDVAIDVLQSAIDGIFEVLEPHNAVLAHFHALSTADLGEREYLEACALVGRNTSFPADDELRPVDGSALVDFESERLRFQVEWGVVAHDELLMRLTRPEIGRAGSHRQPLEPGSLGYVQADEEAPATSIMADVQGWVKTGGGVPGPATVLERAGEADLAIEGLVRRLYNSFTGEKEQG